MSKLTFLTAAICCLAASTLTAADAAPVTVQLFPQTGDVRLLNPSSTPLEFVYYQLNSPSGRLVGSPGIWTSIDDTYDVSGNGFIDPVNEWTKLPPTVNVLAEGLFVGSDSALPAYRSIGLGQIWVPHPTNSPDITAQVVQENNQNATVTVQVALAGDYDRDLEVDIADYMVWKLNFNSTASLNADGNYNGIVDAADYTIWRNNFGASLQGFGAGSESLGSPVVSPGGVVPEPASAMLAVLASGIGWSLCGRRARRHVG